MALVEQEPLTLPEHISSPPVCSGVRVTRSLVVYVCFVDRCLSFCTFSFGHCVVCSSSIYGFWLHPFGIFKLFFYLLLLYIIWTQSNVIFYIYNHMYHNNIRCTRYIISTVLPQTSSSVLSLILQTEVYSIHYIYSLATDKFICSISNITNWGVFDTLYLVLPQPSSSVLSLILQTEVYSIHYI